jgi:hypothetical protein
VHSKEGKRSLFTSQSNSHMKQKMTMNGGNKMDGKWMVYDTASGDIIFHDTVEKAQQDYDNTSKDLEGGELLGENKVYIFRVEKVQTIINYPED